MKVNERTLIHIANSSENPVDHSGWLYKLSDDKKTFQKKWCVLKENLLFLYDNKSDKEPIGVIILEGYRVELVENVKEYFAFKIDFGKSQYGLPLKSYTFGASSPIEMERWVKSLSCASYDYLKMVVSELQHRLDEINTLKKEELVLENKSAINQNPGHSSRFNPFNNINSVTIDDITFLDLHEEYGARIRKLFLNSNHETNQSDPTD